MIKRPWNKQGKRLSDYDLPRIGHEIGVGEDIVHMLMEVESRGKGFERNGVVKLFEKHVFYRNLPKSKQAHAVRLGLATPGWHRDYSNNHATFVEAHAYDPTAALKACSWGLGQVLGENARSLGYASAYAMVVEFAKGEAQQLEGMIRFIKTNGLDDELREMEKTKNHAKLVALASAVARVYNGRKYREHQYHLRLVRALVKWRKIKDTPWTPNMAEMEEKVGQVPPPKQHWINRLFSGWRIA